MNRLFTASSWSDEWYDVVLSDREFHESISTYNPALRVESDQDASVKVVPRDFTQTFERLATIETAASSSRSTVIL